MITLAHPLLLLLLIFVPALLWWWRRRVRPALRFSDGTLLAGLPAGRAATVRRGGIALRGAGLAALVLALAGPRWPDLRTRVEPEGIAVMMVLDVSGSMAEPDFNWNGEPMTRLAAARRALRLFVAGSTDAPADGVSRILPGRPTDLVGLVVFGTHPECLSPLTLSHAAVLRLLDTQQAQRVPDESETNLSDAIALGLERLRVAGDQRKVLILLTDGEHNVAHTQSHWSPRQAAYVAAGLGVPIYTIDAGGVEGAATDATERRAAAIAALEELARITGGKYFAAHDGGQMLAASKEIDRLERERVTSFQYRRYHEAFPWLALAAFVCMATALGLDATIWRRLP